jgi:hypothetical protein
MKSTKIFYSIIILLIVSTSCQKENLNKLQKEEIKFYASYSGDNQTKATSTFASGNKVTIMGYSNGANTASESTVAGTPIDATCGSSGLLTTASPIYLPKGNYDFYSVSLNNSTVPEINFSSGISGQLTNGKDYLWAKCTKIANGGNVSFVYWHKAVGIEIIINSGTGISNLIVTSINFTPTAPSSISKMTLSDGSIVSANSVGSLTAMALNNNKGTFIMLPVNAVNLNVEVIINASIGGTQVTGKKYTATIPAQNYLSGSYYMVNLTISSSAMQFTETLIEDWTTQNITGVTLSEQ